MAVTAEQRQLHAGPALGDAIAHRRDAAGELGDAAGGPNGVADHVGEMLERLMGRQHVVIGRNDRDIGLGGRTQVALVVGGAGGEAVGDVGAAEIGALRPVGRGVGHARQIGRARRPAALDQPGGHIGQDGIQFSTHDNSPPALS